MESKKIIIGHSKGLNNAQAFIPDNTKVAAHVGRSQSHAIDKLKSANPDIFTKDTVVETKYFSTVPAGIPFAN